MINQILNEPQNADLLTLWNAVGGFPTATPNSNGGPNSGDPDSMIEEVLVEAQDFGASNDQLGRLSAIMNQFLTLNRGEANGIMYAQFDADPTLGPKNELASDNVVNNQRDGTNQQILITLTKNITSGSFTIRITNNNNSYDHQDITINPVYTTGANPVIDPTGTRAAILSALQGAVQEVGINWATEANGGVWAGPVTVRLLSDQQVIAQEGTGAPGQTPYWDLLSDGVSFDQAGNPQQYVYEVTFQGEAHDTSLSINPPPGSTTWNTLQINNGSQTVPAPDPVFTSETNGTPGTLQHDASIAMTPNGDYVVVWTQDTTDSAGDPSNQNIYYRTFSESTDTAGPQVANWMAPDSTSDDKIVDQNSRVTTDSGLQNIVILFDENMLVYSDATLSAAKAQRDALVKAGKPVPDSVTEILDSVTNTENYELLLNGVQLPGTIVSVQYGMNKAADLAQMAIDDPTDYGQYSDLSTLPSNHWEAVLTIDGDPSTSGLQLLAAGNYTLVALVPQAGTVSNPNGRTGLRDLAGNALGSNGFQPNGADYSRSFTLLTTSQTSGSGAPLTGIETLVNQTAGGVQTTGTALGTGTAQEYTQRSVAMDHSGDFAVVWTSYGQDDPSDPLGAGVYMRLYSRDNTPLTSETLVNTYTKGNQLDGTIAMDAAGDFVVVWASQGEDPDGSWGIYAQRFNSMGAEGRRRVPGEYPDHERSGGPRRGHEQLRRLRDRMGHQGTVIQLLQ